MTWFAIKGPDGALYTDTADPCRWAAWGTAEGIVRDFPVGRSHSGEAVKKRGERAGYRCVEVNLVEPEQASQLEQAFIQGAAWWEWHKEDATMWQSDRALALEEAERRTANGTLGKSPEVNTTTAGEGAKP